MRWLVVVSLVVGCYRGSSAPPANRVDRVGPHALADVLAYLPGDSDFIVAFDMPQIRATATWQKYEPTLINGALAKLTTSCGIDLAAIRRVTLGLHLEPGPGNGVVVVRGMPRDRFMKCIVDPKISTLKIGVIGDVVTATDPDSDQIGVLRFVDPTTLVIQAQANASASTLEATIRAGSPLRSSPVYVDMLGRIDTGAPVWFIAAGTSKMFNSLQRMGYPVKGAGISISVGDAFELVAKGRFETPAIAQQFAATLRAQVGPVQAFVDSLDVADDDVEVKVTVKFTEAQVERLIQMMGLARSLGGP
jgi:hypothetical protein